jgi:hypothetical protein
VIIDLINLKNIALKEFTKKGDIHLKVGSRKQ